MAYFNFPLLLRKKKMQVIWLAPPCPSKRLQLPLLAQRILYLSHIYLTFLNVYCDVMTFFMSKIVFI